MAEEQTKQPQPVSIVLKCQYTPTDEDGNADGEPFGFDLTAECVIAHIPGIVKKLRQTGIRPAQTPYTWDASKAAQNPPQMAPQGVQQPAQAMQPDGPPPACPVHQTAMKPSKHRPGEWFCSAVIGNKPDGSKAYCTEKVST